MKRSRLALTTLAAVGLLTLTPSGVYSQARYSWLAAGSLHNWYSDYGSEWEEGWVKPAQQYGLQWPAFYRLEDIQCWKGLWIGTKNYGGYDHKIVHIGPKSLFLNEFSPLKFEVVTKFTMPEVRVDGAIQIGKDITIDRVDPTIAGDMMIDNVAATAIGITMSRKIFQFSQQFHDNYIVSDYRFTNTNAVTLDSVFFYFSYRLSVCADTRYVFGNSSGWGINSMLDMRGDGVKNDTDDRLIRTDPTSPHMRIQYAWNGKYPPWTLYDNIGGPMWQPATSGGDPADTVGRLGAAQFPGVATLHADRSATDTTDDLAQPSTTSWEGSDEKEQSGNDMMNQNKMDAEWKWFLRGHKSPRHCDVVEPTGNFSQPTGDPSLGTPGGFSNSNGYGPYTLAPGQSIRIVLAEGVSGLSREKCVSIGKLFKAGAITAKAKNDSVFTGRDSLFETFRRAITAYQSGWNIPQPPLPPRTFDIASAGGKIILSWDVFDAADPNLTGFRIYRTLGRYDNDKYELLQTAGKTDRLFEDRTAPRGVAAFYYIVAVGDPAQNTGGGNTPANVPLVSNRIFTQTYSPAYLQKAPPTTMDSIRIVPNPYHIGSTQLYPEETDKILFVNVPEMCRIRIYTELGELIYETEGYGDVPWKSVTSSRQVVVSGVYIVVFDHLKTGQRVIKKLAVIR